MPPPTIRRLVGVFAKYWAAGRVKTRLAADIGPQRAAHVAHAFLRCLVSRLHTVPADKQMGFTPGARVEPFRQLAPGWQLRPQCEGDLGARMADYFEAAFMAGYQQVLLLGADCPSVPLDYLDQAFALLSAHDVVFGPADDGGYYLIAARAPVQSVHALLEHGQWGDGDVLARTLAIADQQSVSVGLSSSWHDVDQWDDLARLRQELNTSRSDPHLFQLQEQLNNILGEEEAEGPT